MRLIDADALFDVLERAAWFDNADRDDIALDIVLNAPTIDAAPVVHGQWVKDIPMGFKCSLCKCLVVGETNFCPNCGARTTNVKPDLPTA